MTLPGPRSGCRTVEADAMEKVFDGGTVATLDPAGLARFAQLRGEAIESVMRRRDANPLGDPGAAVADADELRDHLDFLRPVLEFGAVQPMVDYLRWRCSVLDTRGMPTHHLSQSMTWLAEFFAERLAGPDGARVAAALRAVAGRVASEPGPPDTTERYEPQAWPACALLTQALLAGDGAAARGLFDAGLDAGRTLPEVEQHLVQPALYEVGRLWQANQASVAQEHLATAMALSLMGDGLLRARPAPANGKRVLMACVQGNLHGVGLRMLADAFLLDGWEVQYLGADVPTETLLRRVAQGRPDLLALSVSFPHQLPVVKDILARLETTAGAAGRRPPVILGGLAVNRFERLAVHLGVDGWSPDASTALACAAALVPHGQGASA